MRFSELALIVAVLGFANVRVVRAQGGFGGGGFGGGGFGGGGFGGGNNFGNQNNDDNNNDDNNDNGGNDNNNNGNLALDPNNLQQASAETGQGDGAEDGQADSQT